MGSFAFEVGNASLKSELNISAPTVLKTGPGTVISFVVQVAGSAPGSINDVATDAPTAANQIAVIPSQVADAVPPNWPCAHGILVVPGAGQTVAVSWQ